MSLGENYEIRFAFNKPNRSHYSNIALNPDFNWKEDDRTSKDDFTILREYCAIYGKKCQM